MAKNNKTSQKNKPFNSALFDGLAAIKQKQQAEEAARVKAEKEAAEKAKEAKRKAAAASGYHIDEHHSDEELWAAYTSDTNKLKDDGKHRVSAARPQKVTVSYVDDEADVMAELSSLVNGDIPFCYENNDEYQSGYINGLDVSTIEALRTGSFPYTDHIDLHGYVADEAKKVLKRFLISSRQKGHRCVLVVTGRGLNSPDKVAILRGAFPGWVSSGAMGKIVMAYCTAQPAHGGPGAFYVLLRKNGQRPYMPISNEDESSVEEFAALFGAK